MKQQKILVINPAAHPGMTERIAATLEPFGASGLHIVCETAPGGPALVGSDADVDAAAVALRAFVAQATADIVVIACYADPGLYACREVTQAPVLGVGRCAAMAALARADNFGVIAMSAAAIPRHKRALRQAGLGALLAGERPLPPGGAGEEPMFERLHAAGRALRDEDGAGAVVIGCAEFGALRGRLEAALGVPVIDPVQAAMAIATTILGSR
jgi:Asp/Glu/hydantoin racemase